MTISTAFEKWGQWILTLLLGIFVYTNRMDQRLIADEVGKAFVPRTEFVKYIEAHADWAREVRGGIGDRVNNVERLLQDSIQNGQLLAEIKADVRALQKAVDRLLDQQKKAVMAAQVDELFGLIIP